MRQSDFAYQWRIEILQDLRIPILNHSGQASATLLQSARLSSAVVPHCRVFWPTTSAFITPLSFRRFATLFSMHSRAPLLGVSSLR